MKTLKLSVILSPRTSYDNDRMKSTSQVLEILNSKQSVATFVSSLACILILFGLGLRDPLLVFAVKSVSQYGSPRRCGGQGDILSGRCMTSFTSVTSYSKNTLWFQVISVTSSTSCSLIHRYNINYLLGLDFSPRE